MCILDPSLVNVKLAADATWFGVEIYSFIKNYDGDITSELVNDLPYEADLIVSELRHNLSTNERIENCVKLAAILLLIAVNAKQEKP